MPVDVDSSKVEGLIDAADDELVLRARAGDEVALEHLLRRYKNFARVKAHTYFLIGADKEDLVQEGMIGLYKAIRDFRPDKLSSFRAFAELCVQRQIITAIKTATRQKHVPLNSYVSLNRPVAPDEMGEPDRVLVDVLTNGAVSDPVEVLISGEEVRAMQTCFREILSGLEVDVLQLYLEGKSYQDIAAKLRRHVKSIDNALQRIKRKVEAHLDRHRVDAV
ncbi:MAG: RNA polymerase sporulation sigma factor SigH [Acidobacteria bacterium]|nr:RNA polymerase sporulation sigma factor SigH [Acidobacteriota bacterium]